MKIQNVRLYILQAPLRTPFKTALRTVDRIEDLVVALETDTGEVGWGEAPATAPITGDTLPSIACAIQDFIVPRILGLEIERLEQATSAVQGAPWCTTPARRPPWTSHCTICTESGGARRSGPCWGAGAARWRPT